MRVPHVLSGRTDAPRVAAGAGRIELCSNLDVGGLTPSASLMAEVRRKVEVPIFPMIRSRAGSFVYAAEEMEVMREQLCEMARLGADGFVFGALMANLRVDQAATAEIVKEASGLPVTFHRAFDRTPDLASSLEGLMELGVTRVLTSGGAERAAQGITELASLIRHADGKIGILPAGGVNGTNVCEVVELTDVSEVHARCERDGVRVERIRAALSPR